MATPLPLEGDGLVENLFYFLWSKDDFGGGPRVFVPHTVIFKLSQPSAWYFTSLRSSKIKKKTRANLTNAQIEHEFTKKKSPTDIVAVYIYQPEAATPTRTLGASAMSTTEPARTTIEYFDAAALREFLYKRDKPYGGILQKFILPKGARNATVRAIWSPKICLLERAVNRRNVYDKRFGVYERGVTFDGPVDAYSAPEPVRGAALPGEVQAFCEAVVDHVTRVTYHKYRISRMVLHLKTDADDRLWLLWCSSLRLLNPGAGAVGPLLSFQSEIPAGIRPLDIVGEAHVPEFAPFGRQTHGGNALAAGSTVGAAVGRQRAGALAISSHNGAEHSDHALLFGQARCASCGGLVDRRKLLATTYKAIIEHFTRFLKFLRVVVNERESAAIAWPPEDKYVAAAGGVGFGILPFLSSGSGGGSPHARRVLSNSGTGDYSGATLLSRAEFVIPPVIRFLHPSFSAPDFERHRRDPIFLHKQAAVCEACCLVYADYSTSALEANSIRQSAPALLRPHSEIPELRRRLDPLDPLTTALSGSPTRPVSSPSPPYLSAKQKDKPPASAWKPLASTISESTLSSVRKPLRSVKKTKNPTRMLRFPSAPELPERIDSFEELRDADCDPQGQSSNNHVTEREERFFRELYSQKVLEKGHPLRHMVDSAARLGDANLKKVGKKLQRLAALGGGGYSATLMGSTTSTGALGNAVAETEHLAKAQHWKSPYSIVQRLREPVDDADHDVDEGNAGSNGNPGAAKSPGKNPDKKKSKKKKTMKEGSKSTKTKAGSGSDTLGKVGASKFVSSREKLAADEHRDFLFAALSEAKGQLEHIESLATIIPVEGESDETDEDDEDCHQSIQDHSHHTDQAGGIDERSDSDNTANDEDDKDESGEEIDQRQESESESRSAQDHLDGVEDYEEEAAEAPTDTQAEQRDAFESEPDDSFLHTDQINDEPANALVEPPSDDELGVYSSNWRLAAAVPLPPSDGQSSSSLSTSFPDELHNDQPHPDDYDVGEDDEDEMY